jgi:hypothetical protein
VFLNCAVAIIIASHRRHHHHHHRLPSSSLSIAIIIINQLPSSSSSSISIMINQSGGLCWARRGTSSTGKEFMCFQSTAQMGRLSSSIF